MLSEFPERKTVTNTIKREFIVVMLWFILYMCKKINNNRINDINKEIK